MNIEYSYTKEFEEVFNKLKKDKRFKELANLDGIGEQTDMVKFSKKFFSQGGSPTADASVDSNSNVDDKSVIAYNVEVLKPLQRMNAYYLLYKYGWKLWGKEYAEKLVDSQFYKEIYINDFHTFGQVPYCMNFSCMDVVVQGLPFVKKIKSEPPKHLSAFMGQMVQFVTYASNSIAGAVGLADFIPCMSWYVKKLYDDNKDVPKSFLDKQVKQELQSFIYSVNQPFRGGCQSAFTNFSLYDDVFLDNLCEEYIFPDGSSLDKELVKHLQIVYMDLYNETLRKTPFTFPVTTACFSVDENKNILDNDFMQLVMEKNKEFGFINIFAGKSSVLSSCCFDGSQKVTVVDKDGYRVSTFKELYKHSKSAVVTTEYEGKNVKAKVIRLSKAKHIMYNILTEDNKVMIATDNHIHLTKRGEVDSTGLTTDDYLSTNLGYVKIDSIRIVETKDKHVYCFEMINQEEPYFTLANGINTHNCRLRSDTKSEYFNSFGAGGTKIGSCSVTTLNLPRLAYLSNTKEEFIDKVKIYAETAFKVNQTKRYIVNKRVSSGNLPLYTLGFMGLDRQYNTCGINGVNEAVEILGYDILSEDGTQFVKDIISAINMVNDRLGKEYHVPVNTEQTPKTSGRVAA